MGGIGSGVNRRNPQGQLCEDIEDLRWVVIDATRELELAQIEERRAGERERAAIKALSRANLLFMAALAKRGYTGLEPVTRITMTKA